MSRRGTWTARRGTVLVLQMLLDLNRSNGATLLIVTHDPALSRLTDRIIRLRDGRIIEVSAPGPI